jgi:poly(3-hydroxybutyrate) depolymerase
MAALLAPCACLAAPATAAIASGAGDREVTLGDTRFRVYIYKPRCGSPSLLLVFHGSERKAELARDDASRLGDKLCMLVLAPHFDKERFPDWRYPLGGIVQARHVQPVESWTGHLALELVQWARREEGRPMAYAMLGHSAGGQFLSRLAAFVPHHATHVVLANPGSYVWPNIEVNAPYGFGNVHTGAAGDAALKRYLAQPLTFLLGTEDVLVNPKDRLAKKQQGEHRLERGTNIFVAGKQLAEQRGWPFRWRLIEVPGVGHTSKRMYAAPATLTDLAP